VPTARRCGGLMRGCRPCVAAPCIGSCSRITHGSAVFVVLSSVWKSHGNHSKLLGLYRVLAFILDLAVAFETLLGLPRGCEDGPLRRCSVDASRARGAVRYAGGTVL
jgi:hypothetical protein